MSDVTIRTDHKWKDFLSFFELTSKEKKDLDWIEDETQTVLRYRGNVYALSEFMRIDHCDALKGWHGYQSGTYFSGIVIKVSEDGDQYMIGTYFS